MKWEYKTLKIAATGFWGGDVDASEVENAMNELGREGWELAVGFDSNQQGGKTKDLVLIFKRLNAE